MSDSQAAGSDESPLSRSGWLRAGVLGANDGIVSTGALILGVASANAAPGVVVTAALAGLVAGAVSMALGEYVSVSSQRDIEEALRLREENLLATRPNVAVTEVAVVLQLRGIDPGLARTVAQQIAIGDPVAANIRVKYGISEAMSARPLQAALASAASFSVGSLIPLAGLLAQATSARIALTFALAVAALAGCGALGASLGGARRARAVLRVVIGGALALLISASLGRLVGAVV